MSCRRLQGVKITEFNGLERPHIRTQHFAKWEFEESKGWVKGGCCLKCLIFLIWGRAWEIWEFLGRCFFIGWGLNERHLCFGCLQIRCHSKTFGATLHDYDWVQSHTHTPVKQLAMQWKALFCKTDDMDVMNQASSTCQHKHWHDTDDKHLHRLLVEQSYWQMDQ